MSSELQALSSKVGQLEESSVKLQLKAGTNSICATE